MKSVQYSPAKQCHSKHIRTAFLSWGFHTDISAASTNKWGEGTCGKTQLYNLKSYIYLITIYVSCACSQLEQERVEKKELKRQLKTLQRAKDSVVADLKHTNHTLQVELALAQVTALGSYWTLYMCMHVLLLYLHLTSLINDFHEMQLPFHNYRYLHNYKCYCDWQLLYSLRIWYTTFIC